MEGSLLSVFFIYPALFGVGLGLCLVATSYAVLIGDYDQNGHFFKFVLPTTGDIVGGLASGIIATKFYVDLVPVRSFGLMLIVFFSAMFGTGYALYLLLYKLRSFTASMIIGSWYVAIFIIFGVLIFKVLISVSSITF